MKDEWGLAVAQEATAVVQAQLMAARSAQCCQIIHHKPGHTGGYDIPAQDHSEVQLPTLCDTQTESALNQPSIVTAASVCSRILNAYASFSAEIRAILKANARYAFTIKLQLTH